MASEGSDSPGLTLVRGEGHTEGVTALCGRVVHNGQIPTAQDAGLDPAVVIRKGCLTGSSPGVSIIRAFCLVDMLRSSVPEEHDESRISCNETMTYGINERHCFQLSTALYLASWHFGM